MLFLDHSLFGNFFSKPTYLRSLLLKALVKSLPIPYVEFADYIGQQNSDSLDNERNLRISCIVTCNDLIRIDFLVEALNSIRNQEYSNIQVIIVDGFGGLHDSLLKRGEFFDSRFVFREFTSATPSEARNAFLHELHGDIIVFLDDDNLFLPGYFHKLNQWYLQNPLIDVGIFRYVLFKEKFLIDVPISRKLTKKLLVRRNISDTSAMSFNAKSVVGNLWPKSEHGEDWALLKKYFLDGYNIQINNSFCMLYRVHPTNRSTPMSKR